MQHIFYAKYRPISIYMIVLVQAFEKIKSKKLNITITTLTSLYGSVRSSACRLAYSRQQYEAGIIKNYSAIVLPMLRRTL